MGGVSIISGALTSVSGAFPTFAIRLSFLKTVPVGAGAVFI